MGRVADLWASLYSAPLAGALLAAPFAWPRRGLERAVVAWTCVRGALPLLAAANVATLVTGVALAAVGFGRVERDRRAALAHRAAGAFGVALAFAAVLRLGGASPDWRPPWSPWRSPAAAPRCSREGGGGSPRAASAA